MKNNVPLFWTLRILVAVLFIFSAATKLMPVESFEKQLVDDGITNWCFAPILAGVIISTEFFLGLALLQNHLFKKIILPATAAMLIGFCIYLVYQISTKGNSGNCGCMGQIIPMTPIQALSKNIITLGILGLLFYISPSKNDNQYRFPITILLACFALVFLYIKPAFSCDHALESTTHMTIPVVTVPTDTTTSVAVATEETVIPAKTEEGKTESKVKATEPSVKVIQPKEQVIEKPAQPTVQRRTSIFAPYTTFNTGSANLDYGKSIVCLFNSDCDHCMNTAKEICEMNKDAKLPPVYILFWGEESQAAAFFKFAGCSFPYTFIDAGKFFRLLEKAPSPPRVVVLNEGNIMGDFTSETFSKAGLKEAINK
ncbi:MAG: hypothetical protein H7259_05525 [Cytophagales bacterium]|nr:hypothetical protein [Cytophaga sp.]